MSDWKEQYRINIDSDFTCDFTTSLHAGNTDFHMHDHPEIYLLLEGNVQYFVESSCYRLCAGDMVVISDDEIHKVINLTNKPFTRLVIHLEKNYIRHFSTACTNLLACFERIPGLNNQVVLLAKEREDIVQYANQLQILRKKLNVYGCDIETEQTLLNLLINVNRAWNRSTSLPSDPVYSSHRVGNIMDYVEERLTETLTLDSISEALSLDKYYISHLFKQETQDSLFHYILIKRIVLAKQYLKNGSSVSESCELSGFNDYSNFIRSFRKVTGYTPKQYQKLFLS